MKKYEVNEQTINAIAQVLHNLDVGSKTLSGIVEALKKKEIVETAEKCGEPKTEVKPE